jgi:transposase-like protein
LRRATLTQDVIALEKPLIQAATITTDSQILESVDCPDCSDTMLKFYDWDKMKYLCEDCGLTINNPHS